MKSKGLFASIVAALMITTIFAGCSSKPAAANKTQESTEPVTLTFWHTYSDGEQKVLKEKVIPQFEATHKNIKIKAVVMPYDGLKQQVIQGVSGNSAPDLMRMDIVWTPEFAKMGALVQVDSLDGFTSLKDKFFTGPLQTNYYDGHYYGVPLNTNTKAAIYNKKLLEQVGLTKPPKTYDELLAAAPKLKNGQYLIACDGANTWSLPPYFLSFGGKITDDKYTVSSGYLNSKESIDALTKLVDLADKKIIGPAILGGKPDKWGGLNNDSYLMGDDGPWFYSMQKKEVTDKTLPALLPEGPGGSISVVGGENLVMFKNSKHQKEAWEFAKYLLSEFPQKSMALGAGLIPTVKDVANSPEVTSDPMIKVYVEQLKTAWPRTPHPNWEKISDKLNLAFESAFRHKKTPQQALDDAVKEIDPLLK